MAGVDAVGYEEARSGLPQEQWLAAASNGMDSTLNDAEVLIQPIRSGVRRLILSCVAGNRDGGLRPAQVSDSLPLLPSQDIWLLVHPEL